MNRFEVKALKSNLLKIGVIRSYSMIINARHSVVSNLFLLCFFKYKNRTFIVNKRYKNSTIDEIFNDIEESITDTKNKIDKFLFPDPSSPIKIDFNNSDKSSFMDFISSQILGLDETPFVNNSNADLNLLNAIFTINSEIDCGLQNGLESIDLFDYVMNKIGLNIDSLVKLQGFCDDNYSQFGKV